MTHEHVERGAAPLATPSRTVIDMRDVGKDFGGTTVLRDLALQVTAGEIFGLIGPSGSGKSTTIHLLCGHLRPDRGTVSVMGETPIGFSTATRRRIGYMPQSFILYPDLTVAQNVGFAAGLYGMPERRYSQRIRATLELVELWEARDRAARAVSGGMRRRISLAAALVHGPDLLFADEPTANLDPILRAKLWRHFRELSDGGRTFLVTTQYIDEAEHCDRVGLMFDGSLIAEGRQYGKYRVQALQRIVEIAIAQPSLLYAGIVARLAGVRSADLPPDKPLRVTVDDAQTAIPVLLEALERAGAAVRSVQPFRQTFDEVFIRLIEQYGRARPRAGLLQLSPAAEW